MTTTEMATPPSEVMGWSGQRVGAHRVVPTSVGTWEEVLAELVNGDVLQEQQETEEFGEELGLLPIRGQSGLSLGAQAFAWVLFYAGCAAMVLGAIAVMIDPTRLP